MRKNLLKPAFLRSQQRGMSLLEVLVAIVIIAIALLGTAALQLAAMKLGAGGKLRAQAVFLAQDIAERIEANVGAAVAGTYVVANTSTAPALNVTCDDGPCTSAQLAAYDIAQWGRMVSTTLPLSSWSVTQTSGANSNPTTYQIVVGWTDRKTKTSDTTVVAIAESYTLTRTILQDRVTTP